MSRQNKFEIETCYKMLIDSAWFLTFVRHDDNTVTIIQYERDHMPINNNMGKGWVIEEKGSRIVTDIEVNGEVLNVRNQAHVFSYR